MHSVSSPCNGTCRINYHSRLCDGCLRTSAEIGAWSEMSDEHRRQLLATLEQRQVELARLVTF